MVIKNKCPDQSMWGKLAVDSDKTLFMYHLTPRSASTPVYYWWGNSLQRYSRLPLVLQLMPNMTPWVDSLVSNSEYKQATTTSNPLT